MTLSLAIASAKEGGGSDGPGDELDNDKSEWSLGRIMVVGVNKLYRLVLRNQSV